MPRSWRREEERAAKRLEIWVVSDESDEKLGDKVL